MATANELLALAADGSDDKTLIIDNDLRTIIIPKSITNLGTEAEKDVCRLDFQMPRYLGETDLSDLNIRINYMNAKKYGDIYVVTDKKVLSSTITFSWLVGANALMYKGNVNFIVCLKKSDAEGNVLKEFNTTVATLPVLEGLEVDTTALETPMMDILEQLLALTESKVSEVESAGAEQIAKVSAKSVEEQENITNKGAEVLATIPEDYQTTTKLANEGVRTKADAIICSTTGEAITVSDSSDDNLRGLSVFGKSTQVTTTGAQKLPFPYYENSLTRHGVTFTVNKDGSIKMSGTNTATDGASCYFMLNSAFNATGQYIYKCYGLPSNCVTNIYYRGDVVGEEEMLLDLYSGNDYGIVIRIGVGVTVNATVYPMLNEGSSVLPWEPYTGGIPAPNPDYPQEIVSVENPTVKIYGKNLLDVPEHFTFNDVTGIDVYLPAGDYILSFENETHEGASHPEFRFYDNKIWNTIVDTVKSRVVTITKPETKIYVYTNGTSSTNSKGVSATINKLMLSKVSGDYESYKPVQTIPVDHTLPAIPVASGGNYTDSDGQQWICDEVDFERGVYVQRVYELAITGDERWAVSGIQSGNLEGFTRYDGTAYTPNASVYDSVWTHFRYLGTDLRHGYAAWVIPAGDNRIGVRMVTKYTSVDELVDYLAGLYNAGTPVKVLYALETPIETPLTADEIAAFQALRTNYPNTTVLNDSGVTMKLKYNADTETWIRNLIDERIAAAIANIQ